ncbi:MAG: hypothetical protein KKC46_00325 [Proteobacteria bacterium]|nr:hypothetical protein [Pseudomonadota bacterium]
MKSIAVIIPYFGIWPEWFEFFLESCRCNPSVDWLFFTDCDEIKSSCPNVRFERISFNDYCRRASICLKINFSPRSPYKLCDIKPAYGFIHEKDIKDYDYFGYGDIDVIYGNIRNFINDDVLSHNMISTHYNRVSGHFALLKNTDDMRYAFGRIKNWQALFENPNHLSIDESKFTKVFLRHRKHPMLLRKAYGIFNRFQRNNYWQEQFSTILSPQPWHDGNLEHPQEWYWHNGRLTNNYDGDREFMYLHFMNWKSSAWLPKEMRKRQERAAWEGLGSIVHMDKKEISHGFRINRTGFHPL